MEDVPCEVCRHLGIDVILFRGRSETAAAGFTSVGLLSAASEFALRPAAGRPGQR